MLSNREVMMKIAFSYLGTPYIWGGDDPMRGFDCSGFIVELFKNVNLLGQKNDLTAHSLYTLFCLTLGCSIDREVVKEGDLVFYGEKSNPYSNNITHVELAVNNNLCIGASGGGRYNETLQDAIARNSYIKVKPIDCRKDFIAAADPFQKESVY